MFRCPGYGEKCGKPARSGRLCGNARWRRRGPSRRREGKRQEQDAVPVREAAGSGKEAMTMAAHELGRYMPEDMESVRNWLTRRGRREGWSLAAEEGGSEEWVSSRHGRSLSLPLAPSAEDVERAVRTIALVKGVPEEEAYRQVVLSGITLDDLIPFRNGSHEGFILQWSGDMGFGEYTVYRETDEEQATPWHADSECMDGESKRFLKELMRQFVEGVSAEGEEP